MKSRPFLAMLAVALAGCYESSRPLGLPEQGVVDPALAGTWRCVAPPDKPKELAHLLVVPFDRSQYYLEWREDAKIDRYRAHTTRLDGVTLFNLAQIKAKREAPKWMFHRATPRPDGSLSMWVVDRDAVKAKGEAAALEEIARRVRDETLYKLWAICTFEK